MMYRVSHFLLILTIALWGHFAAASNEVIALSLEPRIMKPNEVVTASIDASSFELKNAFVSWSVDKKALTQGVGLKEISFTIKDTAAHELEVTATDTKGITYTGTTVLRASQTDILWEAETLVPPWYKGRALPTLQSTIRAEAMTPAQNPDSLIYTWTQDGSEIRNASGLGKSSVVFKLPMFVDTVLLGVSVRTAEGEYVGDTSVRIRTSDPVITFYEQKPLLGPWFNADVPHATLSDLAPTLFAFPYFMSADKITDPKLAFTVTASSDFKKGEDPFSIILTKASQGDSLNAHVTHTDKLLQEGSGRAQIQQSITEAHSPFGI